MTKKDFELIAITIKDINDRKATGDRISELFADNLQIVNPRFDHDKFLRACKAKIK